MFIIKNKALRIKNYIRIKNLELRIIIISQQKVVRAACKRLDNTFHLQFEE